MSDTGLTWNDMQNAAEKASALSGGVALVAPAASTERLTDALAQMIGDGFVRLGGGERIVWELAMQVLPTQGPQGQTQWNPALFIYAEIPGSVLGTKVAMPYGPLPPTGWTQDDADHHVRQVMAGLLDGRAREAQAMQAQQMRAAADGAEAPHSGLILP
jgi:hypothetical protein